MTYVCFVTRDPLITFNSLYAYARVRSFPRKILVFYLDDKNLEKFLSVVRYFYEIYDKEVEIKSRRIIDEFRDIGEELRNLEEVVIDITGARKSQIIAIMSVLRKGRIVYLRLEDMNYAGLPTMMRPLSAQKIMEVNIDG